MNGPIRPHRLNEGDALNRRRIEENFLFLSQRINSPDGTMLGDRALGRADFETHTWSEFFCSHAQGMNFSAKEHRYLVSDSLKYVEINDGSFEGRFTWSMDVELKGDGHFIMAYPVVDGQPVYGGADIFMMDTLFYCDGDETDNFIPGAAALEPSTIEKAASIGGILILIYNRATLGGVCTVVGGNGRYPIGLMVFSIGDFRVKKVTTSLIVKPR